MGNLILLCGKPGCGKTTLSKHIESRYSAIPFSADDMMLRLFDAIEDRELFDSKLQACKEYIYTLCDKLLPISNIVLDFGFWKKAERQAIKQRFAKHNVILIYLNYDDKRIFNQIQKRNKSLKPTEYFMDKPTYITLSSMFEELDDSENYISYQDNNSLDIVLDKIIK